MAIKRYPIVRFPAASLAKTATPVVAFDKSLDRTIQRMIPTMREAIGIGLAANQVGLPLSLAVIEYKPAKHDNLSEAVPVLAIVNPVILAYCQELDEMKEGCLSCPGIEVAIRRSTSITVRYQTEQGEAVEQTISGFPARIYQHEIDHLNGKVILDRAHGQKALIAAYRADPEGFTARATGVTKR